ncbi:MAG TPA: LLM class flavin-dependent oxidoreductase [Candidatus Acidoferrales bacterium]|nr:LLM class flavin-dependent oxidoreductase [Candidatus Acidoferrales bacterium]
MYTSLLLSGNGELSSQRIPEISQQAEQRGFDGLWFGETTLRDASILAALAACSTKNIQLGTSILNVFTRTPSQLALLAATLNEVSGGRFTLGLGVSTAAIVENWHGQAFQKPHHRLDETVKLLRQYFSGEKVSYEGLYSSPKGARLRTRPSPKIALAALNDGMIAKAAQVADRVILNLHPPQRIKHDLSIIDEACSRAGGKRPNLSVMLYSYVLGASEKGTDAGKELVAFYASAPAYSSLFTSLGYESEAKAMMTAWKAKDRDAAKRVVSSEMVKKLTVLGTIQDLRDRVEEYRQSGVDDVFIAPSPFGEYEANIREVLQHYF